MGSLVKCLNLNCKKSFGKIVCPFCKGMNICENQFKLGLIKCGFANCLKESNMINCIFCRKINIFDLNEHINGKTIKCGYCKNLFNEIANILSNKDVKLNPEEVDVLNDLMNLCLSNKAQYFKDNNVAEKVKAIEDKIANILMDNPENIQKARQAGCLTRRLHTGV